MHAILLMSSGYAAAMKNISTVLLLTLKKKMLELVILNPISGSSVTSFLLAKT